MQGSKKRRAKHTPPFQRGATQPTPQMTRYRRIRGACNELSGLLRAFRVSGHAVEEYPDQQSSLCTVQPTRWCQVPDPYGEPQGLEDREEPRHDPDDERNPHPSIPHSRTPFLLYCSGRCPLRPILHLNRLERPGSFYRKPPPELPVKGIVVGSPGHFPAIRHRAEPAGFQEVRIAWPARPAPG